MADMADKPASKDTPSNVIDLIMDILKNHEQNLDKSIDQLATIIDEIDCQKALVERLERIAEKIEKMQNDITSLSHFIDTYSK
jgi:phosphopantothenate synthetase